MKKHLLTALFILNACFAFAQLDLSAELIARNTLTAAAGSVVQYPDADMLLVEDQTRIRYETDGTYRYITDMAYKILTEKGRQEKSNIEIGYSTSYGTMRFVRAEVIKPDGRVIPVDLAAQSRESINQGQMEANIYDPNQKTIKLTVPDLGIGDVLRYTIASEQTKTVVPDTWSDLFTLEETFPISYAVYEVDAPAALPLARIELKAEIPGTVTRRTEKNGDRIRYIWEVRNVPRMFEEPKMPQRYTVVQRLLLSTIPDWETLSKWYWELSEPCLDRTNPDMKEKVRALMEGLTNRQDKIEAIFQFVSQDVRYMGLTIENEAPGYEPHNVSLTFDNRYGVCRDKAALLVSMLRLAGFDARPVLIYVGPKKDPEVPQPWFNHAITAVRNEDGSWQLMDSTNENTRDLLPAYLSDRSYLVATPEGATLQTSPVVPPEKNLLTIEVDAALNEDRLITANAVLSLNGINDTAYRGRLAALKPEEREPYFEELLKQALGPARLTRLEIRPDNVRDTSVPLSVTLGFEVENALASGPENALLQVPTLINHFGLFGRVLGGGTGLEKRRYPLNTGFTCGITETVRLDLSRSGLSPAALPDYETVDTPELTISRAVSSTNDLLVSRANIMLRTVEFSPEQYLTLKQNLKTSERNARKRVILERSGFPSGADLATLDETVHYTVYDPYNWKEERTVRQQVLTYAGKQQASDIKVTYNPAMQRTSLSSATVTSPDGKMQYIDPENEINVMDAKWSSEAPRYPAEKIMVANLPGVEVGSIIEYRIVSVHRGLPFFSAAEYFSAHNPLVKKTVRVEMPHALKLNISSPDLLTVRQRTSHRNGNVVHEWSAQNRDMIKKEERLPPDWTYKPALLLSCGDTSGYAALVEKTLIEAAGKDKAAAAKARALTKGLKTRLEKITALRDFVDRTVREAGPSFSALPLSAVTPADQVLAEGYGNTADRAVLLYALLDAAGLKPRFVLSSSLPRTESGDSPVVNVLQRKFFDTVLVAAAADKKETVYLGDNGQYAEVGTLAHAGRPAIDLKTGKPEIPQTELHEAFETAFVINLAENGDIALIKKTVISGTEFEKFHQQFVQLTPEERRREHQALLSRISQSAEATGELQTSFDYPGRLQFAANLPAYAVRDGNRIYFNLPEGLGGLLNLKASRRENPFYIEKPVREVFFYEITLPEGWEPVLVPETFRAVLPAGAGFVEVKVSVGPGKIIILQQAQLNAAIIPPNEYDNLLELNNKLTAPSGRAVLLQKP
jgi:transglutaminase-like putative cysteine protease